MQRKLNLDKMKYEMFMEENKDWQKVLKSQAGEIPSWGIMLKSAVPVPEKDIALDEERVATYFSQQLVQQQDNMLELNTAFDEQQKRLKEDWLNNSVDDIDAFCTQDILRDRIKEIEKKFIDLKCSFMKYFSTSF